MLATRNRLNVLARHHPGELGYLWNSLNSVLTDDEIRLVAGAASKIPLTASEYIDTDLGTCLVSTVVDFQMRTPAVERALSHFQRIRGDGISTLNDFERLFIEFADTKEGNEGLAVHLFGYKLWTRVGLLRSLVRFLRREGVVTFADLQTWAAKRDFNHDFEGQVRYVAGGTTYGLGPAVFNWLVMRLGIETVKPDIRLHRFVETAVGRHVSDSDVVNAVTEVAGGLGVSPRQLDWSIWEAAQN